MAAETGQDIVDRHGKAVVGFTKVVVVWCWVGCSGLPVLHPVTCTTFHAAVVGRRKGGSKCVGYIGRAARAYDTSTGWDTIGVVWTL